MVNFDGYTLVSGVRYFFPSQQPTLVHVIMVSCV